MLLKLHIGFQGQPIMWFQEKQVHCSPNASDSSPTGFPFACQPGLHSLSLELPCFAEFLAKYKGYNCRREMSPTQEMSFN